VVQLLEANQDMLALRLPSEPIAMLCQGFKKLLLVILTRYLI